MRLIDADKIQEYLLDKYHGAISDSEMKIYQLLRLLDEQPTIETLPVVRGEWIQKHHIISLDNMTLTGTYPTCSLCGYAWIGVAKNTNYCPNCGAKMEDRPCG